MVDFVKFKEEKEHKPQAQGRRINFKSIFIIMILIFIISAIVSSITFSLTPKIAVVQIGGVISTERSSSIYGDTISSREIAGILKTLETDNSVKAVLLDINSPGGSPVASEEISRAIDSLKKTKPVYALINDVGASGAFWIAVSSDRIYSSSMSTVGSIGVTSAGLGFEQLIDDWNITYRRQVAGEFKDMGTPFREPTEKENKMIEEILDEIHTKFISHVAENRNMSFDEVKQYADGSVFLGSKAVEIGLIDEIGYYPDAINALKEKVDSPNAIELNYGPEPTIADMLGINSFFQIPQTKSSVLLK